MASALEKAILFVFTIAAVALVVNVVTREVSARGSTGGDAVSPVEVDGWERILDSGHSLGSQYAGAHLIEFVDLQCPACKEFHENVVREIEQVYGQDVNVTYVHFPLPMHLYAEDAAIGAECAGEQGRFREFVAAAFALQDSLGTRDWRRYAEDAGVPDLTRFQTCFKDPTAEIEERIARGKRMGTELGVNATPTILVDRWRFAGVPALPEIRSMLNTILQR